MEVAKTEVDDDDAFLGTLHGPNMAALQRQYRELQKRMAYFQGQQVDLPKDLSRNISSFRLRQGILYKKSFDSNSRLWLLVVPGRLRDKIIGASNDHPTTGYLGNSCTLALIRGKYYWPRLAKSLRYYTQTWREGQRRKKPPTKPAGFLYSIQPPLTAFEQIGIDHLSQFPMSNSENRWIVIAMDF